MCSEWTRARRRCLLLLLLVLLVLLLLLLLALLALLYLVRSQPRPAQKQPETTQPQP